MVEHQWMNGSLYKEMYNFVRKRATTRQVRLLMVSCCRLHIADFFDPRIRVAIETAERCADDLAAEAIANALWDEFVTTINPRLPESSIEGEIGRAIAGIYQLVGEVWNQSSDEERHCNAESAIAHAALMCLRDKPRESFTGGSGDAVEYCTTAIEQAAAFGFSEKRSESEQQIEPPKIRGQMKIARLLRDIFGKPFRPVTPDPRWFTSTVVDLAKAIYEGRAFDRMPILADALMDAGCDSEEIIEHCRGNGPHVRGCWVVDLLLGKE